MAVGLVYSEMQAAAQAVADAVEPLQKTLQDLGATIEAEDCKGFSGQAAAGFGEAINAWFDVAITLGPFLEGYSQNLMYVAQEHATNDVAQADRGGHAHRADTVDVLDPVLDRERLATDVAVGVNPRLGRQRREGGAQGFEAGDARGGGGDGPRRL